MHIPSGKGSRPSVLLVNRQKGEGMQSHSAGGKEKAAYTEPKSSSDAPEVWGVIRESTAYRPSAER